MRILFISDLHMDRNPETTKEELSALDRHDIDVAIVAGDIAEADHVVETLLSIFTKEQKVIFIAGNHEFYCPDENQIHTMKECRERIRADLKRFDVEDRLFFLDNSSVNINGIWFIGSTLWTDFKFGNRSQNENMIVCQEMQNDYKFIYTERGLVTPEDILAEHITSKSFIQKEMELIVGMGYRPILITHHLASASMMHERYEGSNNNASFISDLDDLVSDAIIYCCGHTHHHSIVLSPLSGRMMICNPFGYRASDGRREETGYKSDLIVDVSRASCII